MASGNANFPQRGKFARGLRSLRQRSRSHLPRPSPSYMEKGIYSIIKEPHITEKSTALAEQNKYVFKIFPKVNKIEIKKAVEKLYSVKVIRVNIVHSAPKKRRIAGHEGWRDGLKKGFKKAIVTLAKGQKIELLPK